MSVHYLVLAKNALEVVWHPELVAWVQKEVRQLGANGPDWMAPDWRGLLGSLSFRKKTSWSATD